MVLLKKGIMVATRIDQDYISASGLKHQGWTDLLIRRFLPTPDKIATNPHYKCAAPMRLYLTSRVQEIEAAGDFKSQLERAQQRKQAASRAVETKRERLRERLAQIIIAVPTLPQDELIEAACTHYNSRKLDLLLDRGHTYTPATPNSDEWFLHRITVNYIRHQLSSYERQLRRVAGRVGANEAWLEISRKVFRAIGEAYPWLAGECDRQLREREQADEV
jgi:hypothetical protein